MAGTDFVEMIGKELPLSTKNILLIMKTGCIFSGNGELSILSLYIRYMYGYL